MAGQLVFPDKDPDAVRDYGFDWTADIGDNSIVDSSFKLNQLPWEVDADLQKVAETIDGTKRTVIRIGAGLGGEGYSVTNHVILSNGEEDERTAKLKVKDL